MFSTEFLSIKVGDIRATNHLHNDGEKEIMLMARITGLVPEDVEWLIWQITPSCSLFFAAYPDLAALNSQMADLAWWYGWSVAEIDAMTFEDFIVFSNEAARQIKAGYMQT